MRDNGDQFYTSLRSRMSNVRKSRPVRQERADAVQRRRPRRADVSAPEREFEEVGEVIMARGTERGE